MSSEDVIELLRCAERGTVTLDERVHSLFWQYTERPMYELDDEDFGRPAAPDYTRTIDVALTLLPPRAINHMLFSHMIADRKTGWSFKFMDEDQKMGIRAASEQIERMAPKGNTAWSVGTEPRIVLEKAIAEHWLEFHATAFTAPLAICIAAIRCRVQSKKSS